MSYIDQDACAGSLYFFPYTDFLRPFKRKKNKYLLTGDIKAKKLILHDSMGLKYINIYMYM